MPHTDFIRGLLEVSSLRSFVITRIILLIPMVWLLLTLIFFLLRVMPGANPVLMMSPQLPPEQVEAISEELGLNRPIFEQYIDFLMRTLSLDLGKSYNTNLEIIKEIRLAFGPTLMLGIYGTIIGIPLGIILGTYSGAHRESKMDHLIRIFSIGIYSMPIFLVGVIMQIFMMENLKGFPILGLLKPGATELFTHYTEIWFIDTILSGRFDLAFDIILHLTLPSIALGMLIAGTISRIVRTNMIFQLDQDYIDFARSRGISENVVKYRYSSKNAVVPIVGMIGLQFALLLSGAILTETTFSIPGLGNYIYLAIVNRDFPAIQGAFIVLIIVVSVVSLFSDVLYAVLDPRIKY